MTAVASLTIEVPGLKDRKSPPVTGFRDLSGLLDVDFGEPVRPKLVTAILDRAIDADATSADMPLSWRIAALVGLWRQAGGADPEFRVVCPGCDEELELSLSLSDLLAEAGAWELPAVVTVGSDELEIRLPTGLDLERWARNGHDSVMAELGGFPQIALEDAETALSDADPLVDLALQTKCPECEHGLNVPVDLEAEALFGLEEARDRILYEVHRLAFAYSWTEEQVLSMPADRRRRYLCLLDEAEGR